MTPIESLIVDGVNRSPSTLSVIPPAGPGGHWTMTAMKNGASVVLQGETLGDVSGRMVELLDEDEGRRGTQKPLDPARPGGE